MKVKRTSIIARGRMAKALVFGGRKTDCGWLDKGDFDQEQERQDREQSCLCA